MPQQHQVLYFYQDEIEEQVSYIAYEDLLQ